MPLPTRRDTKQWMSAVVAVRITRPTDARPNLRLAMMAAVTIVSARGSSAGEVIS